MNLPTESEWMTKFYTDKLASIANDLRYLADRIEREGTPQAAGSVDDTPRWLDAARRVVHGLHWGLANLGVDRLITDAARIDVAETAAKAEEQA